MSMCCLSGVVLSLVSHAVLIFALWFLSSSPRLYSDYLYFGLANKSVEDFHERVSESLQLFEACLTESSLRSCVYNTSLNVAMPVS